MTAEYYLAGVIGCFAFSILLDWLMGRRLTERNLQVTAAISVAWPAAPIIGLAILGLIIARNRRNG